MSTVHECRCCGVNAYRTGYGCEVCDCDVEEHAQAEKEAAALSDTSEGD